MAMISIAYDTKKKTCSVIMDGQPIEKVSAVRLYKYEYENSDGSSEEESHIELIMEEKLEDGAAYKVTTIYASRVDDDEKVNIDELKTSDESGGGDSTQMMADWLSKTQEN